MPDRSFFINGYQFPVCARCTGVIISSFAACIVFFFYKLQISIAFIFCGVMFCDWLLQRVNVLESTNRRRLITGLLGGFGFMTLQMYLYSFVIVNLFKLFKVGF